MSVKDNKTCRVINVRIPNWVDKTAVKLALDGKSVQPVWAGNYIALGGLKPKAVIRLTFPVEESTERYSIDSYEVRGTKHLAGIYFHAESHFYLLNMLMCYNVY